jgi:hypothetical protein
MADENDVQEADLETTPVVETDADVDTPAVEESAADTLKPGAGSGGAGDSKAAKIADLIGLLSGMDNQWLENLKAEIAAVGSENCVMPAGADGEANRNTIKAKASAAMGKIVKEVLIALFGQVENLSEDFRNTATALFQGAVALRVEAEVAELEEAKEIELAETKATLAEKFASRLDTYLDYISEKYILENKLALESGVRAELSESFLQGIKQVFDEHYVTIPEDKIDVLEGYETQVAELEEQLQNAATRNIELTSMLESREKKAAIDALAEGMTVADREKLETVLEDVDYNDLEDFNKKAGLLKENYFGGSTPALTESTTGLVLDEVVDASATEVKEEKVVSGPMSHYLKQIKKDIKEGN